MGQTTEELNAEIAGTRESLASDLDALQSRVSPSAIVERRKTAAKGRIHQVRARVMGSVGSARSSAGDASGQAAGAVRDGASGVVDAAEDKVEGSPLAAGLVAFGAGMLIAALMPPSDPEVRASQKLVDAAKEHGQPVIDEAKSQGQEMGVRLKESAGQAAGEVKSTAQQSVERVQNEGQTSAQNVKDQAQQD